MSCDLGVIKGELPPGSTSVAEMTGDPVPLGTRAAVDVVLGELFPGYDPTLGRRYVRNVRRRRFRRRRSVERSPVESNSVEAGDFLIQLGIHMDESDELVTFVSFTRFDISQALPLMLAFAARFDAYLFDFSDCEVLTEAGQGETGR